MRKNCLQCGTGFEVTPEDVAWSEKFGVEPPDLCFPCDQKQRLCFRNERTLYNRKCDGTGEDIVTIYSPESPYKVFKSEYWYSDKWDAMDYGMEFDFNKTFFEQYRELHLKVPRIALINLNGENSDYCNMCVGNKNCYLVFGGDFNEDCMYGTLCMHNRDSLDIDYSNGNELCYMMDNSMDCYGCRFVWDSKNCNNCSYVSDCIGCSECMFSFNLRNKSYCIENKQYSKEEYFQNKSEILNGSYAKQKENWEKFVSMRSKNAAKYAHILSCENCTGDYLKNCKDCTNAFDVSDSQDIRDAIFAARTKDAYRVSLMGDGSELIHNSIAVLGAKNAFFSYFVLHGSDIEYSEQSISSQNIFGCNGMNKKQYCILNRQYKKEEFFDMREKIITHMKKTGEWGKFFPHDFSCFGYNESTGMRYFPLSKEQALKEGFKWREEPQKSYQKQTIQVPDHIKEIPDSISKEVLSCETCGKNYKIIQPELAFYKKHNIPIPLECPDCRQKRRMSLRNAPKLYERTCAGCGAKLMATYPPENPRPLFCEKCYSEQVT